MKNKIFKNKNKCEFALLIVQIWFNKYAITKQKS